MEAITIKEFAQTNGFVQIAKQIRTNINGYPFLTFIKADNVAENIYFSKRASEHVAEGVAVTKELLSQHQIAVTKNEAGEERIKLIYNSERIKLISNSERIELSDLLD